MNYYKTVLFTFLVFTSLLAAALVIYQTSKFGPAISPDSTAYLATANNVASGSGFFFFQGPYTVWPPLYPFVLSFAGPNIHAASELALYINTVALAATIFLAGTVLFKALNNRMLAYIGVSAIALGRPLISVASYVMTEMLFIFLVSACLISLSFYLKKLNKTYLLIASSFCALAILERYIGIVVLAVGVAGMLFIPKTQLKQRLFAAFQFSAIAIGPILLWLGRNWFEYSTLTGPRYASTIGIRQATANFLKLITTWILPPWRASPLLGALMVSSLLLIVFYFIKKEAPDNYKGETRWSVMLLAPQAAFFVLYSALILYAESTVNINALGNRFLSPLFVPFWLMMIFAIDRVISIINWQKNTILTIISVFFIVWIIRNPARFIAHDISYRIRNGAGGYAQTYWESNKLLHFLKSHPLNGRLYSNAPPAVFYFTGFSAMESPQIRRRQSSTHVRATIRSQIGALGNGRQAYLLWFNRPKYLWRPDFLYRKEDILRKVYTKIVYDSVDGEIYQLVKYR